MYGYCFPRKPAGVCSVVSVRFSLSCQDIEAWDIRDFSRLKKNIWPSRVGITEEGLYCEPQINGRSLTGSIYDTVHEGTVAQGTSSLVYL